MKTSFLLAAAAAMALAGPAAGADKPTREQMMSPAPNPFWNAMTLTGYETEKIAEDLYAFRHIGTRTIFIVTGEGVIVADPISPASAKILREEIRKVTSEPVKYVVYSHEHWDHVPGAKIFKDEGAQIVAHENCGKHFTDLPHPDIVMPDITFPDDYTLKLGRHSVELIYLGPNHGDCMVFMRPDIERGKYVFVVDLFTPGGAPLSYFPDYAPHHWVRAMKELEALKPDTFINGHGVTLSHPSALTERRRYLEALMAAVKKAIDDGMPPTEIPDKVRLPEFAYLRGYEANIRDNVRRVQTFYGIGW
ncbi:MAG: MBL fold metallo-hydrolase [Rhodospirillaceae bacterium]|nr:MBL fold metallo-hydrolase [Rhodospirillaceae bacterium]